MFKHNIWFTYSAVLPKNVSFPFLFCRRCIEKKSGTFYLLEYDLIFSVSLFINFDIADSFIYHPIKCDVIQSLSKFKTINWNLCM